MDESWLLESYAKDQWNRIKVQDHHGINIALFALKSDNSAGIGEYLDLLPIIKWSSSLGLDLIQLLPLNDTGSDISPYNALSSVALNPIHISLQALPYLDLNLQEQIDLLKYFNRLDKIDYAEVKLRKEQFLHDYFVKNYHHFDKSADYLNFINTNSWLNAYAQFRTLKDKYHGAYFKEWSQEDQIFDQSRKFNHYYIFIQYLCHLQFTTVASFARNQNVLLLGDLPILMSPDSHDVWAEPHFFTDKLRAGAPPDMYSLEGQDWGFPLYDWDNLEKEGYSLWKRRLEVASGYYDLFRIDHVVGFFRIWAIENNQCAKEGHFEPTDPALWQSQGEKLMKMMLNYSPMLPIGEDLGVVPDNVRESLRSLGICGTKVMRWERKWHEDQSFIPVENYIRESLTTVSTHDSETLRLWWQNAQDESKRYAEQYGLEWKETIPSESLYFILKESHQSNTLFHVNLLQEYLSLFDELCYKDPQKERINVPGVINNTNWAYRFKPSVETIVSHEGLKKLFINLLQT